MRNKPTYQQKSLSLQAKRTNMKALWEHCGDGISPIRGQRMAYPLGRGFHIINPLYKSHF